MLARIYEDELWPHTFIETEEDAVAPYESWSDSQLRMQEIEYAKNEFKQSAFEVPDDLITRVLDARRHEALVVKELHAFLKENDYEL